MDVDLASCPDDRRSTGAYCVCLGNRLVSWCSKKQSVVSRSSAESEYRALANIAVEVACFRHLLSESGVHLAYKPVVWCDNT